MRKAPAVLPDTHSAIWGASCANNKLRFTVRNLIHFWRSVRSVFISHDVRVTQASSPPGEGSGRDGVTEGFMVTEAGNRLKPPQGQAALGQPG